MLRAGPLFKSVYTLFCRRVPYYKKVLNCLILTEKFSFIWTINLAVDSRTAGKRREHRDDERTQNTFTKFYQVLMTPSFTCLSAQPISARKAQSRKKAHKPLRISWISQKMCLPCLIIIQSCYCDCRMNKPFRCSRSVTCVSCSVHFILTYYARKGLSAFYLNYPQIKVFAKCDHVLLFFQSRSFAINLSILIVDQSNFDKIACSPK